MTGGYARRMGLHLSVKPRVAEDDLLHLREQSICASVDISSLFVALVLLLAGKRAHTRKNKWRYTRTGHVAKCSIRKK